MKSIAVLSAVIIRERPTAAGHTGNVKYTVTAILQARIGKRLISHVVWRHISNIPEDRSWNWPEQESGQKMMIFPDR